MTSPASRRMRVAVATRIYAPEPAAASFRLAAMVSALVADGAEVDVLTTTAPGPNHAAPESALAPDRVRVLRRPVMRDREGYVRGYLPYLSFDLPVLWRLLTVRRPDVVVAEPPPTTGAVVRLVCGIRRIPYVYYAADVWSDAAVSTGAPGVVVRGLRAVESWAMRGARSVIAVSPAVADRVRELGARAVQTVMNGIDTTTFTPQGPPAPEAPEGPYLVYAGTTSEWQGAEVFVKAMAQVTERFPSATLVVLGQGSGWSDLVSAAQALPDGGACVRLMAPVPATQAAMWLRGAVGAVVSLREGIGYDFAVPTKILAGAACGTPVLFAGPQGPAAQLIDRAGIGVCVGHDTEQVAAAMIRVFEIPPQAQDRTRLGQWAVQHASSQASGAQAADVVREAALPRAPGTGVGGAS